MEKPFLTMPAKHFFLSRPRALVLPLTAIATLLLSACGTLQNDASRQVDERHQQRQAAPAISNWNEQRVAAGTRQDQAGQQRFRNPEMPHRILHQ